MARDPPSLLAGSELRDISFRPTNIHDAPITIVHPQLRDLILPIQRGRVLFPHGTDISEMTWEPQQDEDDDEEEAGGMDVERVRSASRKPPTVDIRPFAKLSFAPNCLTTSRGVLAAGGQHGELFICNLPSATSYTTREPAPVLRSFQIAQTLPTRSINNSILILPTWKDEWQEVAERKRMGYIGRGNRSWAEQEVGNEGEGRYVDGEWVRTGWYDDLDDLIKHRDSSEEDEGLERREEDDEAMDIDEEDEDEDDFDPADHPGPRSPQSPATYPNTVPFFHAPRIPNLPASPATSMNARRASATIPDRPRTVTFSQRATRQSFSAYTMPSQSGTSRGVQIVSSRPEYLHSRSGSVSSAGTDSGRAGLGGTGLARRASIHKNRPTPPIDPRVRPRGTTTSPQPIEPRILISNNDQTVKVFTLRAGPASTVPTTAVDPSPTSPSGQNLSPAARRQRDLATMDRVLNNISRQVLPPVPTFYGGRLGWDSVGMNEGIMAGVAEQRAAYTPGRGSISGPSTGMSTSQAAARMGFGGANRPRIPGEEEEERKLMRVGGTRFRTAINHSSISPDLSMMVSVGDSTDVYLFQVLQGGQEFRKIRTLSAATDSGFSTAWSKDGRKFAVASQDGQVTVWDHRSSHPLAIFHTSSESSTSSSHTRSYSSSSASTSARSPSLSSDLAGARSRRGYVGDDGMGLGAGMVLVDPATGEGRAGSSNSGREAARVVKFSPEGSGRDLMVFSEEHSHIHLIDAKTFTSHVILPVPPNPYATSSASSAPTGTSRGNASMGARTDMSPAVTAAQRRDTCGQSWGIAGVAFDPTGDWLYSGTESTVVEWDLRRMGAGEGGCFGMA